MQFLISDTFMASLGKLTAEEQKLAKTTAFDLQADPTAPGFSFHKLDKARDRAFWSVRVNRDLRLIVHRGPERMLLCYVDHHDKAYAWAERRRLETHPATGAAQLVEIRETVEEIVVPRYVEAPPSAVPKRLPFAHLSDQVLLSYGVPPEWLADVRAADEDSILDIADHLPAEAAEAVLELAVGGRPRPTVVTAATPFTHPDAQRRFRVVSDTDELALALDSPWDRWTVFLHPAQRELVERRFGGPARVSGSAGTGKTIVALHRAVHLARANPDARVLLTTFSEPLASALRDKLKLLIGSEPRLGERIEVDALEAVAQRLYRRRLGPARLASADDIRALLREAARARPDLRFTESFLLTEWEDVVDAWQLDTWEAYRDVARLGRKTRLPEKQRADLWRLFEHVRAGLKARGLLTEAEVYSRLAARLTADQRPPYDFAVVDEAQDVSVPQLRFVAALGADRPDALFFAGDLGQRIFQLPFSWRSLGVDVRGRSATLRINYRTSHQIRAQADRLLGPQVTDVDGNVEDRAGTISLFNGPEPVVRVLASPEEEETVVGEWLMARAEEGVAPEAMGIFVRSDAEVPRAQAAVAAAGMEAVVLDENVKVVEGRVSIGTMHLSKGLEFRSVVVMACDDEVIPLQARIGMIGDQADLEEVYNTERHLLYVACTRARDHLLVTGVAPASEFLQDLTG